MRQLSLLSPAPSRHGGDLATGRRKSARPFSPRLPLHVVLKSTRARGELSLLRPARARRVRALLASASAKHGVRLRHQVNVGNHLHLVLQARRRESLRAFLREVAGRIAFETLGARKGRPRGRFWDGSPFSRLVQWGRDLRGVGEYLAGNRVAALGFGARRELAWETYAREGEPPLPPGPPIA